MSQKILFKKEKSLYCFKLLIITVDGMQVASRGKSIEKTLEPFPAPGHSDSHWRPET